MQALCLGGIGGMVFLGIELRQNQLGGARGRKLQSLMAEES